MHISKKKLLFVIPSFKVGGTTISTLNLVRLLDNAYYDVKVMPLFDCGPIKAQYDGIELLKPSFIIQSLAASQWRDFPCVKNRILSFLIRGLANRCGVRPIIIKLGMKRSISKYDADTIIACQEGIASEFVFYSPVHDKIAWVRCDYRRIAKRKVFDEKIYKKYRNIICVAEESCKAFRQVFPQLSEITLCINNPQDSKYIIERAIIEEYDPLFHTTSFCIVSVGRFDPVKQFTLIPKIAKDIRDMGLDFKWYIIGSGNNEISNELSNLISYYKVGDIVIPLGFKDNPYFYISRAHLLVCLSKSEACPRVINEAKILGTPTISNDFPTIHEFIKNGYDGKIVRNDEMAKVISSFISDKHAYNIMKSNCEKFVFDNHSIMNALADIFG